METKNVESIGNYAQRSETFTLFKMIDNSMNDGTSRAIPKGSTLWCVRISLSDVKNYIGNYLVIKDSLSHPTKMGLVKAVDLNNKILSIDLIERSHTITINMESVEELFAVVETQIKLSERDRYESECNNITETFLLSYSKTDPGHCTI